MSPMVPCAVSLAVLLGAGVAHAEPATALTEARLVYTRARGAERCPDEPTVREAVRVRLGYDPFRADAPRTVRASIAERHGTLRADVKLTGARGRVEGSRQLDAARYDCDELVAAMALAIAIAVDPASQLRAPPPPPPPPVTPAPTPSEAPAPSPSPAPARPPELPWMLPLPALLTPEVPSVDERVRFRAGLALVGAAGSAPHVTGGLSLAAGARWRWLSTVVEARADQPTSTTAAAGGSVSATLLSLTLAPCFHWRWLLGCALASVGRLRGVGSGVPGATSDVTSFGAAGARVGSEVPLGANVALAFFSADAAALLPRTSLQLRGHDVWTTAPVTGTLRVGVVADFP